MLPSLGVGREWCQLQCIYSFWSVWEYAGAHTIKSLASTEGRLGGRIFSNWYLGRLSISHFTTSASITVYWQGMRPVLIDCRLILIRLVRTYWCPHHYEYRNYSGVAWWYKHWQLVSGEVEYIPLHYKCFHHWVLARNEVSFDRFPDFDLSKNILMPTRLWV